MSRIIAQAIRAGRTVLTIEEVGDLYGLSRTAAYREARKGSDRFPTIQISTGRRGVPILKLPDDVLPDELRRLLLGDDLFTDEAPTG